MADKYIICPHCGKKIIGEPIDIVRCKECINIGNPYKCRMDRDILEYGGQRTEIFDDWFCADGERRKEE